MFNEKNNVSMYANNNTQVFNGYLSSVLFQLRGLAREIEYVEKELKKLKTKSNFSEKREQKKNFLHDKLQNLKHAHATLMNLKPFDQIFAENKVTREIAIYYFAYNYEINKAVATVLSKSPKEAAKGLSESCYQKRIERTLTKCMLRH